MLLLPFLRNFAIFANSLKFAVLSKALLDPHLCVSCDFYEISQFCGGPSSTLIYASLAIFAKFCDFRNFRNCVHFWTYLLQNGKNYQFHY